MFGYFNDKDAQRTEGHLIVESIIGERIILATDLHATVDEYIKPLLTDANYDDGMNIMLNGVPIATTEI